MGWPAAGVYLTRAKPDGRTITMPGVAPFLPMPNPDLHSYYHHTRFDYRSVWNGWKTRAVHFGFYDDQATRHHVALENMNRILADLAGIRAGERVLDAGCGWGSACFWLSKHRQAETIGISLVAGQVDDCRRFANRHRIPRVSFLQADYCQTPFPDATFDVVWACESLCHALRKIDFYREAYRVLKPGGRLVLAEYIRAGRPLQPAAETLLANWLRPWAIPDLDTEAEHRANAAAAGFNTFDLRNVTPNVQVSLRNLNELSGKWLPLGRFLHRLGLLHPVRLRNAEASRCQYEALQAGAWWYGMGLCCKGD